MTPGGLAAVARQAPPPPPAVTVDDHLEGRIRKPVDLLRCLINATGIVLLAAAGTLASATAAGVETNLVEASRRLPYTAFATARSVVLFALLILPIGLAIEQIVRRQGQRLAEATGTGALAAIVMAVANALLRGSAAVKLYDAITMSRPGVSHLT